MHCYSYNVDALLSLVVLVAIVLVICVLVLANAYGIKRDEANNARKQLRNLLADDGRLIDMLVAKAKREIDEQIRRERGW